ncbi:hypothetical protein BpHYR1_036131 [Brachionus plicatilis]|uniref:Uncharacterized protein n=1 Tax=Brachionus plicatilis TaxID=10195 RepID=A0A3M7S5R5_BRAPC|nr:hypothetical protein BpHYR1_036131 [Brachionus plicatilis]
MINLIIRVMFRILFFTIYEANSEDFCSSNKVRLISFQHSTQIILELNIDFSNNINFIIKNAILDFV